MKEYEVAGGKKNVCQAIKEFQISKDTAIEKLEKYW